mgnify:FL=1
MNPRKGPTFGAFDDPREAFETLVARGELPPSVMDDAASGRRGFLCRICWGATNDVAAFAEEFCGRSGGHFDGNVRRYPNSADDAQVWAGAEWRRAEELAAETIERMRPWAEIPHRRCVWVLEADPEEFNAAVALDGWIPKELARVNDGRLDGPQYVASSVAVGGAASVRAYSECLAWDDPRPCPWIPMLEIRRLGCGINNVTSDGSIVLVMPRKSQSW